MAVEGSKIDESVQSAFEDRCTSCGKAAFAFGEAGLYLRAENLCIGGRVGAFPPRSDVEYLGNRRAYDLGREIWGSRDRFQQFDESWPLRRSTGQGGCGTQQC